MEEDCNLISHIILSYLIRITRVQLCILHSCCIYKTPCDYTASVLLAPRKVQILPHNIQSLSADLGTEKLSKVSCYVSYDRLYQSVVLLPLWYLSIFQHCINNLLNILSVQPSPLSLLLFSWKENNKSFLFFPDPYKTEIARVAERFRSRSQRIVIDILG